MDPNGTINLLGVILRGLPNDRSQRNRSSATTFDKIIGSGQIGHDGCRGSLYEVLITSHTGGVPAVGSSADRSSSKSPHSSVEITTLSERVEQRSWSERP
jgi:hypothetical protein